LAIIVDTHVIKIRRHQERTGVSVAQGVTQVGYNILIGATDAKCENYEDKC